MSDNSGCPHAVSPSTGPDVCVVVPTFNEAGNVAQLLTRLGAALTPVCEQSGWKFEVVFVDDSSDDTPRTIESEAAKSRFPIRLIHRATPDGGLGGAVLEGLRSTAAPWTVVMDADLQHPPETVPAMLAVCARGECDLVVATRYASAGAGAAEGLGKRYRVLVSRWTTAMCKMLFSRRLAGTSDPMSGFFAVRGDVLEGMRLHPSGYKILLEIAVRCAPLRIAEVPYVFQSRFAGESKASFAEGLRFLKHLFRLRVSATGSRRPVREPAGLPDALPDLVKN